MPDLASPPRLVGQPLLYAISLFASLGVFLVRLALHPLFVLSDPSPVWLRPRVCLVFNHPD